MMAGVGGIAGRLYRGEGSINFVRRQRTWYTISGIILLVSIVALLVKGLNFSQDFTGGSSFTFPANSSTTQNAISRVVTQAGGGDASVQYTASPLAHSWTVQTSALATNVSEKVAAALGKAFGITQNHISVQLVGPT